MLVYIQTKKKKNLYIHGFNKLEHPKVVTLMYSDDLVYIFYTFMQIGSQRNSLKSTVKSKLFKQIFDNFYRYNDV